MLNARGLHARAASELVKVAAKFPCDIWVSTDDQEPVDAKSVMGVLLLCGSKGTVIEVRAVGEQAADAVVAIGELFRARFGEAE